MATRFYLPSTGAAAASPAFNAGWVTTLNAARLAAVTTRISSAMSTVSGGNQSSAGNELLRQYVSAPLAAQTIIGTIKGQIRGVVNHSAPSARACISISKCAGNGTNVVQLLAPVFSDDFDADALGGPVFPLDGTLAALENRRFEQGLNDFALDLTSQAVSAGDRLIIEIGYSNNTAVSSRFAAMSFGDNSGTDLPEDETTTAANNPWVEFSMDISFEGVTATVDHAQAVFQGQAITARYIAPLISAQAAWQGQNVGAIAGGGQVGTVVHAQATFEGQQIPFIWSVPGAEAQIVAEGGDISFQIRIKGFFANAAWQGQNVNTIVNNSRVEPVIGAQAVFAGSVVGTTQTGAVNIDDMVEDFKPQLRPMSFNITDTDSR